MCECPIARPNHEVLLCFFCVSSRSAGRGREKKREAIVTATDGVKGRNLNAPHSLILTASLLLSWPLGRFVTHRANLSPNARSALRKSYNNSSESEVLMSVLRTAALYSGRHASSTSSCCQHVVRGPTGDNRRNKLECSSHASPFSENAGFGNVSARAIGMA